MEALRKLLSKRLYRLNLTVSTRKNAINLYIIQGTNIIIPLLTLPFLGRALGPTGFGMITFAQIILQYLILITDFGFNLTATRRIAAQKHAPDVVSAILSNTSAVRILFAAGGSLLTLIVVFLSKLSPESKQVVYIAQLSILGSAFTPAWLFHGLERNGVLAILSAAPRLILLIPTIIFVKSPSDLHLAAYLQFTPQLLTGILCATWIWLASPFKVTKITIEEMKFSAKDGFHVFSASILTSVYTNINGLFIKALSGDAALGVYSAAEKLVKAVNSMVNPAIQAIYPKVCSGDKPDLKPLYISIFSITIGCWLGSLILGQFVITTIYGNAFLDASDTLKLLTLAPIFSGASAISVQLKILATGNHKELKSIYALSALSHFIHAPIFIWFGGAMGAAISVSLTELTTLVLVTRTANRLKKPQLANSI